MIYLSTGPSTLYSSLLRRNQAAELNNDLARAEQELSTGYKSDIYKSLGVSAAEALNLNSQIDKDEAQSSVNTVMISRLDMTSQSLNSMRETVQEVLDLAVSSVDSQTGTATGLQTAAKGALVSLIAQASQTYAGQPLFSGTSGTAAALQEWSTAQDDTGLSPQAVFEGILSGGLTSVADVDAALAQFDAIFSDSAADADTNFQSLIYNGSVGNDQASTSIGDGISITYGVQANDEAFREVIKGLAMLATMDPSDIEDDAAYGAWMTEAVSTLGSGVSGLLESETMVSSSSARIEAQNERIADRATLYKSRLLELDGVDAYEAASNVTMLQTQLEASYTVTARLSQLSFLNYMP